MPGLTGWTLPARSHFYNAHRFDEANGWPGCEIVFITAYDQYAVQAFEQAWWTMS